MCLPRLTCGSIVYRAVLSSGKIDPDTGRVKAEAFFRRKASNEEAVSVFIECTPEEIAAQFSSCVAVVSLHVGFILDLGLVIERDQIHHANIFGLPLESLADRDGIYRASKLAQHCRYVMRPQRQSAARIWDCFNTMFMSTPLQLWHVIEGGPDQPEREYWKGKMADGTVLPMTIQELAPALRSPHPEA